MRSRVFVFSLLSTLFSISLHGFEIPRYAPETVFTFDIGTNSNQLNIAEFTSHETNTTIPIGIDFTEQGELIVLDIYNGKVKYFDSNFTYLRDFEIDQYLYRITWYFWEEDGFLFFSSPGDYFYGILNNDGQVFKDIYSFNDRENVFRYYSDYFLNTDLLIIYQGNGEYKGFSGSVSKEGRGFMSDYQLRNYITENDLPIEFGENGEIFENGLLEVKNYDTYKQYWLRENLERNHLSSDSLEIYERYSYYAQWIGYDEHHNQYFSIYRDKIVIFSSDGNLIGAFESSVLDNLYYRNLLPGIHPSGDLYIMSAEDSDEITLYRWQNTWDPELRAAWYGE